MATPNRVDAITVRKALKAAGIRTAVRITSGQNYTSVVAPDVRFSDAGAEVHARIAAALQPLWNDDRVEASAYQVLIERAGYHKTLPLETELAVLVLNGVHPGRVAELREDSTLRERVAELAAVVQPVDRGQHVELEFGGYVYRLSAEFEQRGVLALEGRLLGSTEWSTRDLPILQARAYLTELLRRVEDQFRWARAFGTSVLDPAI